MEKISVQREIPVKYEVDIMIAGGGPAGCAAALAAARQGKTVFLAESLTAFGGMSTSGLLPMFCVFSDGVNFLAGGIGREILDLCYETGAAGIDERDRDEQYASYVLISSEALKRLYDKLMTESGALFSFQTNVIGAIKENDTIKAVICYAKSGVFAVKAKVFIDCTGDGDLAAAAAAGYQKGDADGRMMAGSLCSIWAGVDWSAEPIKKWDDGRYLDKARDDGIFTVDDPGLPGMYRAGATVANANAGHAFGVDGTDEVSLTAALIEQRRRLVEYYHYYKSYMEGYSNVELVLSAGMMGIRESRRIDCDYRLVVDDFINKAVFDDEIGRYAYRVDFHPTGPGMGAHNSTQEFVKGLKYKKGESYGIPYRSLTVTGFKNLLVAGRCVCTDRYMLGSIRVVPGCYITGQAAGVAAALSVDKDGDAHGFEVSALQKILVETGGYLPNYKTTG